MRLIEMTASDADTLTADQFLESIAASEGRALIAEVVVTAPPLIDKVTNPELTRAFGADAILLNYYDVNRPNIAGVPSREPDLDVPPHVAMGYGYTIRDVRNWTGVPVGLNLEPSDLPVVSAGRRATGDNAQKAWEQGANFVVITGNPATGVDNRRIVQAIRDIKEATQGRLAIIAGKMHAAGIQSETADAVSNHEMVQSFADAGADVILLPAPGTVPGMTVEKAQSLIARIKGCGKLAMTTIGTSQEGADEATVKQIALYAKMAGADLHHIGDAGFFGVAVPENILAYAVAVKGRRHTYRKMALSIKR
jgi:putative N-acetylmannosamine-6-phosphate epimerase